VDDQPRIGPIKAGCGTGADFFLSILHRKSESETSTTSDEEVADKVRALLDANGVKMNDFSLQVKKPVISMKVDRLPFILQVLESSRKLQPKVTRVKLVNVSASKKSTPLALLRQQLWLEASSEIGSADNDRVRVAQVVHHSTTTKDRRSLACVYAIAYDDFLASSKERTAGLGEEEVAAKAHRLADAHLRFRLLGRPPTAPCSLGNETDRADTAFVFYNYARLKTIERNFRQWENVEGEADFSVLAADDGAWELVFGHLGQYEECPADDGPHRVVRFLSKLSRAVSKWYRCTRVLLEPMPHLVPTILARVALVKCLIDVYAHAFAALDVKPTDTL